MQQITSALLALLLVSALFLLLLLHIAQLLTRDRLRSKLLLLPKRHQSTRSFNKSHSIDQTPLLTKLNTPPIRSFTLACRSPIKKSTICSNITQKSCDQLQCKCNDQSFDCLQNVLKQQQKVLQQQLQQQLAGLEKRLQNTMHGLREIRCSCRDNPNEYNKPISYQIHTFKNDASNDTRNCPLHDYSTLTHPFTK